MHRKWAKRVIQANNIYALWHVMQSIFSKVIAHASIFNEISWKMNETAEANDLNTLLFLLLLLLLHQRGWDKVNLNLNYIPDDGTFLLPIRHIQQKSIQFLSFCLQLWCSCLKIIRFVIQSWEFWLCFV